MKKQTICLYKNLEARNVKINGKEALIVLVDGDKEQLDSRFQKLEEEIEEMKKALLKAGIKV